jgi:hypothetical protein
MHGVWPQLYLVFMVGTACLSELKMNMDQRGVCPQVEARCVEGQRAWEGMERDLQLLRDEVDDRYAVSPDETFC